jgi:hypothetical protein
MPPVFNEATAHQDDEQVQVFVPAKRDRVFSLQDSPVADRFYNDRTRISQIMGPVGSGKSVATMQKLLRIATEQAPNWEGIRKTRFAVVRNTYSQLEDTTIKTWMAWFPAPAWGKYKVSKTEYHMKWALEDGTVCQCEILFRALDRPDQVDNLLSAEYTGAWFNESRHIDKNIFDMMDNRIGRYPDPLEAPCTWLGIVMDTNPPDEDHWLYNLFEVVRPDNCIMFKQPSGLSPQAENRNNLPADYYENIVKTKDEYYVNVYVHGQYGFLRTGKAIYPEYNDHVHCDEKLRPVPGLPLYVGLDFGLTPAAVIVQVSPLGQLLVLDELTSERSGIKQFIDALKPYIAQKYPNHHVQEWICDPAGKQSAQTDLVTPFMVMMDEGIYPVEGTQALDLRIESVKQLLNRMVDGEPALVVSPNAAMLRKGFAGHYQYRRLQVSKERYTEMPDKNEASHVHDALQYACTYLFGSFGTQNEVKPVKVVGCSARR